MAQFVVIYDACVLYRAPVRDLLLELATTDLFRARWSDRIHEEWIQAVLRKRPDLSRERLERTRELMDDNVRDSLVTGFEPIVESLDLPDPKDRHVLAAAIAAGADAIVTYNLRDFPEESLAPWGMEAQHPDEFIMHLLDLAEPVVVGAAKTVRARLRSPVFSADEYLGILEKNEISRTAHHLRAFRKLI